jgi:diguanylate cyclase (GGDEF)-like protein
MAAGTQILSSGAPSTEPRALTVAGAARFLGVHPNTVRAWSDRGQLHCLRINGRGDRRFPVPALREFIARAERAGERPIRGEVTASAVVGRPHGVSLSVLESPDPGATRDRSGERADRGREDRWDASKGVPSAETVVAVAESARGAVAAIAPADRRSLDLHVLGHIIRLTASGAGLVETLTEIAAALRAALGATYVSIAEATPGGIVVRGADGIEAVLPPGLAEGGGLVGRAIAGHEVAFVPLFEVPADAVDDASAGAGWVRLRSAIALPVLLGNQPWGALSVETDQPGTLGPEDVPFLEAIAFQVAGFIEQARIVDRIHGQLDRATAMQRAAAGLAGKFDVRDIFDGLLDHAVAVFGADRAAVFSPRADGVFVAEATRGMPDVVGGSTRTLPDGSLLERAVRLGQPLVIDDLPSHRHGLQKSLLGPSASGSAVAVPLLAERELVGLLLLVRDVPHPFDAADFEALDALASQVGLAVRNARTLDRMATWAAQLRSVQQLGGRISGLTTVADIGRAIATELQLVIDTPVIRVYRLVGDVLLPMAWRSGARAEPGVADEPGGDDSIPVVQEAPMAQRALRHGRSRAAASPVVRPLRVDGSLAGWIARSGIAEIIADVPSDSRADREVEAPGGPASALVAPLTFEGRALGLIMLERPGTNRFTDDELRLLVIYATFAAQALANAEATERLEAQSAKLSRQLRSQQELLGITESILATLDSRVVVEQVADRLGSLVRYDGLVIRLVEGTPASLIPIVARGPGGVRLSPESAGPGDQVSTWVVERGQGVLLPAVATTDDDGASPSAARLPEIGRPGHPATAASCIVVPLRGHERIVGALALERRDAGSPFTPDEFELVTLFAAQASIALRNAEVHRQVEIQAETDGVTGLRNHGTFKRQLGAAVSRGDPFSLLMLDLDGFKRYNDTFGHPAGDDLLHRIATALRASVRESDVVFRYGGDEFSLLLPRTDARGSLAVANKIMRAVRVAGEADEDAAVPVRVTCSIGVAAFPTDGADLDSILLAADRACYASKRSGRDRVSTADDGLALASEFLPTSPTPVDALELAVSSAARD